MNANPPEGAAALERSAGDACAIPKTVDQFRPPMVDDPTYAALHGRRYDHLRRASIVPRRADYRKATGSRDVARALRIHTGRACRRSISRRRQGAKRGTPSLALD